MTQTHSKSRQVAENAFARAQSQFRARETVVEELDAALQATRDKTARLKEARLARELEAAAAAPGAPRAKPTRKA
ncbi:hypothetical protein GI374_03615 [Paracoccus sp. S-4012]|uniref:hypothetical protein n=1 Tax=Paracoccus sp. S-4012 TaxID=2665648 RepID=UPI0012AFC789|nr:hypothetical protein [Paracoccus sp. S-4012]MRX49545.1 hypothetical protein [Paracoccus sp. S-4012]